MHGEMGEGGIEDLAADIVEKDVDAIRAGFAQAGGDVLSLVVDGRVEARRLRQPAALVGAAGDADRAAALDLRDLADEGAGGAGSTRDHHRLAGLGTPDVEQAEIGRGAVQEDAQRAFQRKAGRELGEPVGTFGPGADIFLPGEDAGDDVADPIAWMAGGVDAAGGDGADGCAQPDRGKVGVAADPAALGRVAGEHGDADHDLAVGRFLDRTFDEAEVLILDLTARPPLEKPAPVSTFVHVQPLHASIRWRGGLDRPGTERLVASTQAEASMADTSTTQSGRAVAVLWENIKTIVYALLIAFAVRTFVFEPFSIPSGSMIPTLLVGDYVFTTKFSYGYSRYSFPFSPPLFSGRIFFHMPHRGDVAVFRQTKDTSTDYIKRVVGLPGDTIQMRDGQLYLDGQLVPREDMGDYEAVDERGDILQGRRYLEFLPTRSGRTVKHQILKFTSDGWANNTPVYTVPAGDFFAMGDDRDDSEDSRFQGPDPGDLGYVPMENLVGKAQFIFFSIDARYPFWEFWEWPFEIRWSRLFTPIH